MTSLRHLPAAVRAAVLGAYRAGCPQAFVDLGAGHYLGISLVDCCAVEAKWVGAVIRIVDTHRWAV